MGLERMMNLIHKANRLIDEIERKKLMENAEPAEEQNKLRMVAYDLIKEIDEVYKDSTSLATLASSAEQLVSKINSKNRINAQIREVDNHARARA